MHVFFPSLARHPGRFFISSLRCILRTRRGIIVALSCCHPLHASLVSPLPSHMQKQRHVTNEECRGQPTHLCNMHTGPEQNHGIQNAVGPAERPSDTMGKRKKRHNWPLVSNPGSWKLRDSGRTLLLRTRKASAKSSLLSGPRTAKRAYSTDRWEKYLHSWMESLASSSRA